MSTPGTHQPDPGRIVVGVDGSASSEQALRWAVAQARLTGRSVDAVISWDFPVNYGVAELGNIDWGDNAAQVLTTAVKEAVEERDTGLVTQRVVRGHPARVLLDAAAGAELLVVGSRGHGGFAGMLLGSTSQHVLGHAHCPVVVVRAGPSPAPQAWPDGDAAPVT